MEQEEGLRQIGPAAEACHQRDHVLLVMADGGDNLRLARKGDEGAHRQAAVRRIVFHPFAETLEEVPQGVFARGRFAIAEEAEVARMTVFQRADHHGFFRGKVPVKGAQADIGRRFELGHAGLGKALSAECLFETRGDLLVEGHCRPQGRMVDLPAG